MKTGLAKLAFAMAFTLAIAAPAANAASPAAQKIATHFSSVQTMTGDFVQFGPKGEQIGRAHV